MKEIRKREIQREVDSDNKALGVDGLQSVLIAQSCPTL